MTTDEQTTETDETTPDPAAETEPSTDEPTLDETPEPEVETDDDAGPNREAAKYRRRLREAEAQLTERTEALDGARRAHVEALIAADGRATPAAVWGYGAPGGLEDVTDEAGNVDPAKVTAAIARAGDELGLPMARRPQPDPTQGNRNPGTSGTPPTWTDALRAG